MSSTEGDEPTQHEIERAVKYSNSMPMCRVRPWFGEEISNLAKCFLHLLSRINPQKEEKPKMMTEQGETKPLKKPRPLNAIYADARIDEDGKIFLQVHGKLTAKQALRVSSWLENAVIYLGQK